MNDLDHKYRLISLNALAALYVVTLTLVKLSILFLYKRLFSILEVWFRKTWWIMFFLTLMWAIACFVLIALQGVKNMSKLGFSRLGIGITGLANAFSDLLLLLMPIVMIFKMKFQLKQKIAMMSVFGIGVM